MKRYFSNTKQIQSVHSNNCGYFCVAFVLSFVFEEKYEDFLAKFSENFIENEEICHNLIFKQRMLAYDTQQRTQ